MSGGKFADAVCVWQVQRQPGVRSLPEHPQHRPRLLPQQPRQHAQHELLGTVQSVSLQEIQQVKSRAPFSKKKDLRMQQTRFMIKNAEVLLCCHLVMLNDVFKS